MDGTAPCSAATRRTAASSRSSLSMASRSRMAFTILPPRRVQADRHGQSAHSPQDSRVYPRQGPANENHKPRPDSRHSAACPANPRQISFAQVRPFQNPYSVSSNLTEGTVPSQQNARAHGGQQGRLHGSGPAISRICADDAKTRDACDSGQRRDENVTGRRRPQVLRIPRPERVRYTLA